MGNGYADGNTNYCEDPVIPLRKANSRLSGVRELIVSKPNKKRYKSTPGISGITDGIVKSKAPFAIFYMIFKASKPMIADATKLAPTMVKPKSTMSIFRVMTLMVPPIAIIQSSR